MRLRKNSVVLFFLLAISAVKANADPSYLRDDQKYPGINIYNNNQLSFNLSGNFNPIYFRDMQDYYSSHTTLRRDNYMILGKLRSTFNYKLENDNTLTAFISTNFNYTGEKSKESPFTVDKQYVVYSNKKWGDWSFGSVDGLYEEVALWSDVTANFGGVANVPTFVRSSLSGVDNSLITFQYRKALANNLTFGFEFTTPDVSYRTGIDESQPLDPDHKDTNHNRNFRFGMERKEAGAASLVYNSNNFSIGAVYHYSRLAHTHNHPNDEGDAIREVMRYRTYINMGVIGFKAHTNRLYYAAGASIENVKGTWRKDSTIGPLVKSFNRAGFAVGASYDLRENSHGFLPAIEYDYSRAKQKAGINPNDTTSDIIYYPYDFMPFGSDKDLSSKRADPYYTNKLTASISYFFNTSTSCSTSYAVDLRKKSSIHNSSQEEHLKENQFALGCSITF